MSTSEHDSPDRIDGLDTHRIDRYLRGEETVSDLAAIASLDAITRGRLDAMRAEFRGGGETIAPDAAAAYQRFRARVGTREGGRTDATPRSGRRTSTRWFARTRWIPAGIAVGLAATILAIALAGHYELFRRSHPVSSQIYATAARQRATVVLSDGSRVTLAPRTTLTVSAGFGPDDRLVRLDGHAYFDVVHTAGRPFTVQAGRVTTRVLGTAFDVVHYADDRDVRVVVVSGKVAMTTSRRAAVTLVPGMMGRVTDSTTLVSTVDDLTSYQAWTHGPLEFRNVPVRDVLQTVGHWYGLRFTLTDSTLAAQRITTFLDYPSTRDLIAALETVLGVTATSSSAGDGPVVTLRPRLQSARPVPRRRDGLDTFSSHSEVGR